MKRRQNKVRGKVFAFLGCIIGTFAFFMISESANALQSPYGANNALVERNQFINSNIESEGVSQFYEATPSSDAPELIATPMPPVIELPTPTQDIEIPILSATPDFTENPETETAPTVSITPSPLPTPIDSATPTDAVSIQARSTILNNNSIIVYSFDELKGVLTTTNDYTTVYLGSDIQMQSSGIQIHASKTELTIDGQPPGTTERHVLKDYASLSATAAINIRQNGLQHLTVRNLEMQGLNHYGPFVVYMNISGVTITYENVEYRGPQLAYNRAGTIEIKNSKIDIVSVSTTGGQEVAEAAKVFLEGNVAINHANSNSVFWLGSSDASLTIRAGANVIVNGDVYFIYADVGAPTVTIENGANFELYVKQVLTYGTHQLQSFSIQENARFVYRQSSSINYASIRIQSQMIVEKNATLDMQRPSGSKALIEMTSANAAVTFDQPMRIKLANAQYAPIVFSRSGTLTMNTSTINLWRSLQLEDQMQNMPDYIWNKNNTEPLTVSANFTQAVPSSLTSNLQSEDPIVDPLNTSTFNLSAARVLALGQYRLTGDATTKSVYGFTEPNADLKATYDSKNLAGLALSDGSYSIKFDDPLPEVGSRIVVLSHNNFLKARQFVQVVDNTNAVLRFANIPENLEFVKSSIPAVTTMVARVIPNWTISIWDGRGVGSTWRLDASIDHPLQAYPNGSLQTLPNALVFVDSSLNVFPLSSAALPIYYGTTTSTPQTDLVWPDNQGFLVQLRPGMGHAGETFQTQISWQLIDAP